MLICACPGIQKGCLIMMIGSYSFYNFGSSDGLNSHTQMILIYKRIKKYINAEDSKCQVLFHTICCGT